MTATRRYEVLIDPRVGSLRDERQEFALDVLEGLSEHPKRLSSRWLYDDRGSELFSRIMDLPQYYPTDCEREILEDRSQDIVSPLADRAFDLVDLGAGDGRKTELMLRGLLDANVDVRYVPIDISEAAVAGLDERLARDLPGLEVHGLVSEYTDGLRWLASQDHPRPRLVLLLGSNIGNFTKPQARGFLRRLWTVLAPGDHVLVGFDLKKDIDLLLAAYNDPQGITSEFNRNLLRRINAELGGHFHVDQFRHFGTYDVFSGAMKAYLVSLIEQEVWIDALSQSFTFDAWEPIHTEYSYKYLDRDIKMLAESTGYAIVADFPDRRGWFVDSLWRVQRQQGVLPVGASAPSARQPDPAEDEDAAE